jgi:4-amino-4-deoxy-L-arabinose transferase-like glycosyltransferase
VTFGRGLALIAAAGLAARLAYALLLVKSKPLLGDGLEFHLQANLLADGKGYIQPFLYQAEGVARASADKPPLYPFLEAGVSLLGGRTWAWHQLVGCLAGTGTVAVVGLVGRRAAGPRAGLIAAGLAAGYPLLVAADGSLRSESVYALCIALVLLAALRYRDAPSARGAALLGVAVAAAALTRGEALALLVLLALPLCGWRRAGVAALACVVVLAPWLARSWIVFDRPVLISTNVGGLLAGANCDTTYHGALIGQWDFGCIPPPVHANEALEAERLRDRGLSYARHHAGRVPVVEAARLGRSFELYRPREQARQEAFFEGRNLRVEQAGVACYYVLALLAAYGVVVLRRRDGPWAVLLAPVALVILVTLISYGFTRLRVAAEPAIVVLAAVALDALAARRWRAA